MKGLQRQYLPLVRTVAKSQGPPFAEQPWCDRRVMRPGHADMVGRGTNLPGPRATSLGRAGGRGATRDQNGMSQWPAAMAMCASRIIWMMARERMLSTVRAVHFSVHGHERTIVGIFGRQSRPPEASEGRDHGLPSPAVSAILIKVYVLPRVSSKLVWQVSRSESSPGLRNPAVAPTIVHL